LSGWTLSNSIAVRRIFSGTAIIPAGCVVVILGGGFPVGALEGTIAQMASG
jgi:hypothetical protein